MKRSTNDYRQIIVNSKLVYGSGHWSLVSNMWFRILFASIPRRTQITQLMCLKTLK